MLIKYQVFSWHCGMTSFPGSFPCLRRVFNYEYCFTSVSGQSCQYHDMSYSRVLYSAKYWTPHCTVQAFNNLKHCICDQMSHQSCPSSKSSITPLCIYITTCGKMPDKNVYRVDFTGDINTFYFTSRPPQSSLHPCDRNTKKAHPAYTLWVIWVWNMKGFPPEV